MLANAIGTIRRRLHHLDIGTRAAALRQSEALSRLPFLMSIRPSTPEDAEGGEEIGSLVREGERVALRRHVLGNRAAFQRWYADPEIAYLLRHDLQPLTDRQSQGYFDTIIMPLSATGHCFAIHERGSDLLIGTTALTDIRGRQPRTALFRIVIGEKDLWGRGYGTEATRLVVEEAFERLGIDEVRLEVFAHNPRAISAYQRVGFHQTGEHVEYVGRDRYPLHVEEMAIDRASFERATQSKQQPAESGSSTV